MPRPKTKIPADLLPELEARRSEQAQTLGQLRRFLARHGVEISENALSWQLLRNGIDLPPHRRQPQRQHQKMIAMRNGHLIRRYTPDEDRIIRHFGSKGWRQSRIAKALRRCGYPREPHSVLGRMMILARHEARTQGD